MISQACAGLLFDPGMGKTTTTYCAISILLAKKFIKRVLVIAPIRVAYNVWPKQCKEWKEFEHLRVGVMHGPNKEAILQSHGEYDMLVVNPEGLVWLTGAVKDAKGKLITDKKRMAFLRTVFDVLVVDESTKFKDGQTTRFKLLKEMIPGFKRRYILTGTIAPNGLLDLFGQIYILDEGQSLGRYITHYRNEYFYPDGYGGYNFKPQPGAVERIIEKIKPLTMRLKASDYLELPELRNNDIYVDLPPAARKRYEAMHKDMMAELDYGTVVAANAAVASSKCRQICQGGLFTGMTDDHWEDLHDEKVGALEDLLEQLNGAPLLIAYQFRFDEQKLADKLKIPKLGTTAKKDAALIEAFRAGKLPALMGHPETISLGLDGLQDSCHNLCWYGLPWNLLHYLQTIDRIKRQGSEAKYMINHRILVRNTVDERVLTVLDQKDADQEGFLDCLKREGA